MAVSAVLARPPVWRSPLVGIAFLVAADMIGIEGGHISFAGIWGKAIAAVLLGALWWLYRTRAPIISEGAKFAAAWLTFTAAGCILTYLAGASSAPLIDAELASLDTLLGFDWLVWNDLANGNSAVAWVLDSSYAALLPLIVVSIATFAICRPGRNAELLWSGIVAILITSVLFGLYPSMGPWVHYGVNAPEQALLYVADMHKLRSGLPAMFDLANAQGIIPFPSFHAVLAVLFAYAHRDVRTFWPVAIVCAVMWLSAAPCGGHYLTDLLAGTAIAVIAISVARQLNIGDCK